MVPMIVSSGLTHVAVFAGRLAGSKVQDGLPHMPGTLCFPPPSLSSWVLASGHYFRGGNVEAATTYLEVTEYHFYYILVFKTSHRHSPDITGGEIDSIFWWLEQLSHIAKGPVLQDKRNSYSYFQSTKK